MTDIPPSNEPPLAGNTTFNFNQRSYSMFGRRAAGGINAPVNLQVPGLKELQRSIGDLTTAIDKLDKTMKSLSDSENKVKNYFNTVKSGVKDTNDAVKSLNTSMSQSGTGGTGSTGSFLGNIMPQLNMPTNSGGLGTILGGLASTATYGINYLYNRAEQLRGSTVNVAQMLGPYASQTGLRIDQLMGQLGRAVPFGGDINNILGALDVGRSMGFTLGGGGMANARGVSFGQGIQQLQNLFPGIGASTLAQQYGGMMANVAGSKAWYLMGGVPNYGAGAVPKSFSEWAEGFLQFFQNQRPGSDRGRPFTKEELTSQMFPGSNINAWFQANAVPATMIDAWWQYAITKAQAGGGGPLTQAQIQQVRGPDLARQRLLSESIFSRRDLTTGASMYQSFSARETTDQQFAKMVGQMDNILTTTNSVLGSLISKIPTPIMQTLMGFINNLPSLVASLPEGVSALGFSVGDPYIGDSAFIGDGPYGATSTAGLHPDLANGIQRMMAANPNIRVTSGLRSAGLQQSMNRRGVGRVAPNGRSNHTRGWAADLGPASQHGWIAANASRFGLQNFASHGEPWHVQLRGVGAGDPAGLPIGDFLGIGGDIAGAIGSAISAVLGPAGSILKSAGGFVSNLMGGNLMQALGSLFNVKDMFSNIIGGLFSMVGLPDIFNPFKLLSGTGSFSADDITNAFLSMMGGGLGAIGNTKVTGGTLGSSGPLKLSPRFGISSASGINAVPNLSGAGSSNAVYGPDGSIIGQSGSGITVVPPTTGGRLTMEQVAQYAYNAGFRGQDLIDMVAIAKRESNLTPTAHNPNRATGDDSYGLWQINMLGALGPAREKAFGITSYDQLYDPATSAHAAYVLYQQSGDTLRPWGGYKGVSNTHGADQYLSDAAAAVHNLGLGDPYGGLTPGMYSALFAPTTRISSTSAPVTIINHINISPGSMDGLDVRYVAKRMASANVQQAQAAFEVAH